MNLNDNRISDLAYQIWESEGRPHGQAARHWEIACKLAAEDISTSNTKQLESEIPGNLESASPQQQADAKPAAKTARKSRAKTAPQMN